MLERVNLHPHSTQSSARRHGVGMWSVALSFMTVMAFSTVPTPLYRLYQARDGFSTFTVTLIFAVYAVGVIAALIFAGHISDTVGRRRTLVPAVLVSLLAALVFLTWRDLPGLLVARVLSGLSVGLVASTATAFVAELHLGERPGSSARRAQLVSTTANLGGFALGPLIAGVLAQEVQSPLTVPFIVFGLLLAAGAVLTSLAPETVTGTRPRPRYHPQRIAVPPHARLQFLGAAAAAFVTFAALGLFTALGPAFLAGALHETSLLLSAVPAAAIFAAAVAAQLLTGTWPARRALLLGMPLLGAGMLMVLFSVWNPHLGLFLAGGVTAGAGGGLLFKAGVGLVTGFSAPERRAEALAGFFLAGYLGISIPVVGMGVLVQYVDTKYALSAFVVLVLAGIATTAICLRETGRVGDDS